MAAFRFGVDSLIWTKDFSKNDLWILPKAKELGFDVVDLAIFHPESFPLKEVQEAKRQTGLEVVTTTSLGLDTNLISPDETVRKKGIQYMKQMVDVNKALGSQILGGVSYAGVGYLTGKPRSEQEWEWSVRAMREISDYAKETWDGVIAVECVNRFETHFLNIAADAVRYCQEVGNKNLKVHLDFFHMIREENSFTGAVETCGTDYLGYVHANENNRGVPGTGLVPFAELFQALLRVGYHGPITIEKLTGTEEKLVSDGLKNLKAIAENLPCSS